MRLATVRAGGGETAAVVTLRGVSFLADLNRACGTPWSTDLFSLVESGEFFRLCEWLERLQSTKETVLPGHISYGPPYRRPRKIWGIGLNYTGHARPRRRPAGGAGELHETGHGDHRSGRYHFPARVFEKVTAEAELGVVIGRRTKDISQEEAFSHVAGFLPVLDMTAEDILLRNPRCLTRAKSFDTFFSFGPELVTPDEVGEVGNLTVATVPNGEIHRENTVSNMTFSPEQLVAFHSRVMTLLPGDLISTGTPGAVEIKSGDRVSCRITGFAPLSNPVG